MNREGANELRRRLLALGLSEAVLAAAWPSWWSPEAEQSASVALDLRFSLARKLGLDPESLLDPSRHPRYLFPSSARFKRLRSEDEAEQAAISSFGRALGAMLAPAVEDPASHGLQAGEGRSLLLKSAPFVGLSELLGLCWGAGIPVIHLRVLPRERKRMAAMAVSSGERDAILLAQDSLFPAKIAFFLAHELGHLMLGHVGAGTAIVDLGDEPGEDRHDEEELAADRYALELLTGHPDFRVGTDMSRYNAPALADAVLRTAPQLRIEPGTLAMCFGYSTSNWAVVNSALKFIYRTAEPVWTVVNKVAASQLHLDRVPGDARPFIEAILGMSSR